ENSQNDVDERGRLHHEREWVADLRAERFVGKPERETHRKGAHNREHEIRQRADRGDLHHPGSPTAKAREVDGNRLGVTKYRQMHEQQNRGQDDRAERVYMRDWIEREAAGSQRGVIAKPQSDDSVHHLVRDDCKYRRHRPDRERSDESRQVLQFNWSFPPARCETPLDGTCDGPCADGIWRDAYKSEWLKCRYAPASPAPRAGRHRPAANA